MSAWLGFTLTVHRASAKPDRYGHTAPPVDHTVDGCAAAPAGSSELTNGQATTITQDTIYAPFTADVTSQDTVSVPDGQPIPAGRYQVDGEPARWQSPYTATQVGTVIRVTRVS